MADPAQRTEVTDGLRRLSAGASMRSVSAIEELSATAVLPSRARGASASSSRRAQKGLKVLGLSTTQLVGSFLDGPKQGGLANDEYFVFVDSIMDPSNDHEATEFLRLCIVELSLAADGKKRLDYSINALITTIFFLITRVQLARSSRLLENLKQIREQSEEPSLRGYSLAEETFRAVQRHLVDDVIIGEAHMIQLCTLYTTQELSAMTEGASASTSVSAANGFDKSSSSLGSGVSGGEFSLINGYILKKLREHPELSTFVVEKLIHYFGSLQATLKISPLLSQTKLLAMLFFVQELLTRKLLLVDEKFEKVYHSIRPFYVWPLPFSSRVEVVVDRMERERRIPGINMVEMIIRDARVPYMSHVFKESNIVSRPAFYFIDSHSLFSSHWYKIMALELLESSETALSIQGIGLTAEEKARLVLMVFSSLLGSVDLEDVTMIRCSNYSTLSVACDTCLKLLHQSPTAVRAELIEKVGDIKKYLRSRVTAGEFVDIGDDVITDPGLISALPVRHFAVVEKVAYKYPAKGNKADGGSSLSHSYPETPFYHRLHRILSRLNIIADPNNRPTIRLVGSGSDRCFHALLCAFMAIRANEPLLLASVNIDWFVVPFEDSLLCSFIARHDAWYNRHIYQPFRTKPFMLPFLHSVQLEFPPGRYSDEFVCGPGAFLRQCLSSYLREAECTFPIQVYRIEAWEQKTDHSFQTFLQSESYDPDRVIPFIARLEISVRVEARAYQAANNDSRKLAEILEVVTLPSPQLTVGFSKMNLAGEMSEMTHHDDVSFRSLVLANVPIPKDPCFPCDPGAPWLEMYGQLYSSSSKNKRSFGSEMRARVGRVDISSPAVPFTLLLDSNCFGPFHRVVVTREDVSLSLQTFFPVKV